MIMFSVPNSGGAKIAVEIFANVLPENTIFIHGNLASNNWWLPALEQWQKRGRGMGWQGAMILVEFRGCGHSSAPKGPQEVDMDLFAQDFISLAEHLKSGEGPYRLNAPFNLVGHSTGGLISALMGAKRPDLFDKVLLLDPVGAHGVTFDDSMLEAFEQMKASKDLTAAVIGGTIKDNNPDKKFFKDFLLEDAFHAVQTTGPWVLQALRGYDATAKLKSFKGRALVLHGEHDGLLPMEDSKELATLLRGKFQILPHRGHCANVENAEQFVQVAHDFLFAGSQPSTAAHEVFG